MCFHSARKEEWMKKVLDVFEEATISSPFDGGWEGAVFMHSGGKNGIHTEKMGYIISVTDF